MLSITQEATATIVAMDDGKANALSFTMIAALRGAVAQAASRGRPMVLSGRDGVFSGGFDLAVMKGGEPARVEALVRSGVELYRDLLGAPIPVIAACSGHALAAGALLLLAVDVRVAARGPFRIGLNEVEIGLVMPEFGLLMARDRLPRERLTAAVVLADVGDPVRARTNGFVDEVVDGDVTSAAIALAGELHRLDVGALAETKLRTRERLLNDLGRILDAPAVT